MTASSNNSSLKLQRHHPDAPLIVEPILRMAAKYQFDSVRTRIVEHIKADWPSDLREWEQFEALVQELEKPLDTGYPVLDLLIPEPASAICLARRYDIPEILPAAFYALSTMRIAHDYDEHRASGDDGMYQDFTLDQDATNCSTRTARWKLLDARDMRVLSRIREYFNVDVWLDIEPFPCPHESGANFMNSVYALQQLALASSDILYAIKSWTSPTPPCHSCEYRFTKKLDIARRGIWPALKCLVDSS